MLNLTFLDSYDMQESVTGAVTSTSGGDKSKEKLSHDDVMFIASFVDLN